MKKKHLLIPLLMMFSVTGCVMYNGLEKEEAEHEHTYAETYSFNETDHWFAATCEHEIQESAINSLLSLCLLIG